MERIFEKLESLVGKAPFTGGKRDFTKTSWKSDEQKTQFSSWFESELRRDKALWKRVTGRVTGNTVKACRQCANEFDWQYGPKDFVCEKK